MKKKEPVCPLNLRQIIRPSFLKPDLFLQTALICLCLMEIRVILERQNVFQQYTFVDIRFWCCCL